MEIEKKHIEISILRNQIKIKKKRIRSSQVILRIDKGSRAASHVSRYSIAGCEISTGPGTNASEMLAGPVKSLVYFQLN